MHSNHFIAIFVAITTTIIIIVIIIIVIIINFIEMMNLDENTLMVIFGKLSYRDLRHVALVNRFIFSLT